MVVRITTGKTIRGALHYNEAKVTAGVADLILSSRFGRDNDELTFMQKLSRFTRLIRNNPKVKTNTVHISLNFAPGEKIDTAMMQQIAVDYMQQIGFGQQPFLVYRHDDTNHPHIHIVTTSITATGKAINLHNLARLKSEPARKDIEQRYGLTVAQGRRQSDSLLPGTRSTISNTVREITSTYQFTSLEQLNAILAQYNIVADRGRIGSFTYERRGLTYSLIDRHGGKIGPPIKASDIYTRPGLNYLEERMKKCLIAGVSKRSSLKKILDRTLLSQHNSNDYTALLAQQNIRYQVHTDLIGGITDVIFINNLTRTALSAIEAGYDPVALNDRLRQQTAITPVLQIPGVPMPGSGLEAAALLFKNILSAEQLDAALPEFMRKKKRKRRSN